MLIAAHHERESGQAHAFRNVLAPTLTVFGRLMRGNLIK